MTEELTSFKTEDEYYAAVFETVRETLSAYDDFLNSSEGSDSEGADSEGSGSEGSDSGCETGLVFAARQKRTAEKRTLICRRAALSIQNRIMIIPAYVIKTFCKDDFMIHCFFLALAGELDTGFGSMYARYPENDRRIHPSLDFCIRTYTPWQPQQLDLLRHYYKDEEENWNLIFEHNETTGPYPLYRKIILRRNIMAFIMNFGSPENGLPEICRFIFPEDVKETDIDRFREQEDLPDRIVSSSGSAIFWIIGNPGSGRKQTAVRYFSKRGKVCMCIDTEALEDQQLPVILSEAKLRNAGICLWNTKNLFEEPASDVNHLLRKLLGVSPVLFISSESAYPGDKRNLPAPVYELHTGYPSAEERQLLWSSAFESNGLGFFLKSRPRLIAELSARFTFTPGQIKEAAGEAALLIGRNGQREDLIYQACLHQITHKLGERAMRIESRYTWKDLVLPDAAKKQLQNACDQIRYHQQVYEQWGFDEKIAYGRGVSMLFCGAPGTGKTMAAQVIANSLHMELYKVELSAVMSKYIGETQKALNEIFDEVKKSQSILFFDEADSLFAKRSEVKGSNDRYANSETAYLLQKMEEYEGIVILATNYVQNFDTAFKRRIKLIIEFTLPEVQQRLEIWENIFPEKAPMEEALDYYYLAENFSLSGSNIKNIAVAAAFRAAAGGRGIRMEDILLGIREEISKSGKQMHSSEFNEYAQVIENYFS